LFQIQTVTVRAGQCASFAQAKGGLLYISAQGVTNVHDDVKETDVALTKESRTQAC
jgi:hypothetical protein